MKIDFDKVLAVLLPLTWIIVLMFGIENRWITFPLSFCVGASIPGLWMVRGNLKNI